MIRRVVVVVPAADEERLIAGCLASIAAARSYLYRGSASLRVQTIVVLDNCRDQTAANAAASGEAQLISISARNVGAARRAGAHAALSGADPAQEVWLASTDADSLVPVNWLEHMIDEARRGTHLVLGTAMPAPGLRPSVHASWLSQHHLREGHPHVHGANLGIRGDAYRTLGGWAPVRTGEDIDLARRAAATGHLRISRTAAIPVLTSTRRAGRAPRGFSSYLRNLEPGVMPCPGLAGGPAC